MHVHTLIIGSGAAGLAAASQLAAAGVTPLALYTEGLKLGTSINTGSDKQTYYKLGLYGSEADAPALMAADLARGGSVHGDLALVEAALSPIAFARLVALGVPFPHDLHGQYIGYKTDHDPRRRATSTGPYTSRDMCLALVEDLKRRQVNIAEHRIAVSLLTETDAAGRRCTGAVFINTAAGAEQPVFETVSAEQVVFAVGGPGGLYAQSVYPAVHTGAIGLALEAGAKARNLPESQFGLASTRFRWNVSGSYMQVLPRFVSTAADGHSDPREFLREAFASPARMADMVFLKGYQWPFAAGHRCGSSLIDLLVFRETAERGRRVFLDYRRDPDDFDFSALGAETRDYLERSQAVAGSPCERLQRLNSPALELYRRHHIDLAREPLEIAVCAQHNNGGLAADLWWQSENLRGLFPIGEVNGSHGVTRPGGSALNAGQCGAARAASLIAHHFRNRPEKPASPAPAAAAVPAPLQELLGRPCLVDWRQERRLFQQRTSTVAGFLREEGQLAAALPEARAQLRRLADSGLAGLGRADCAEHLRNRQLLTAQLFYLEAILFQVRSGVGSRGGAAVLAADGEPVHPDLPWRMQPENPAFRQQVLATWLEGDRIVSAWEPCRQLPHPDGWFENVWESCRTGELFREEPRT